MRPDDPANAPADAASDDLVVIKASPLNAETPTHALAAPITPSRHVYVRSNFETPLLSAESHRIAVGGAVHAPFEIGIDALRGMEQRAITTTMECAGNDRLAMRPLPPGEPWESGAVSTVRWTGVPLAAILEQARLDPDVLEIVTAGADAGPRADAPANVRFARSLPVRQALHEDTLLALTMNGEPLAREHGAPARLVVPGWYGMASVKWVARIEAITVPFDGYFQTRRYVYTTPAGSTPVDLARVKSIIVAPADGATVDGRTVELWGWAWSGAGPIARVEVSAEAGEPWIDAQIAPAATPYEWSRWTATVVVPHRGRYAFRSRATDATGDCQPDSPIWNALGYGNNAVRTSIVEVR